MKFVNLEKLTKPVKEFPWAIESDEGSTPSESTKIQTEMVSFPLVPESNERTAFKLSSFFEKKS